MLTIKGLRAAGGGKTLLGGVDLSIQSGETVALLGASGSGKSLTGRAVLNLPPRGVRYGGSVRLMDQELMSLSDKRLRALRGPSLAMVFQEPATALNPVKRIGTQMAEPWRIHTALGDAAIAARVNALLDETELSAAGVSPDRYPHELSGGQRQRVALAIAVALKPKVIVADEPTSALDAVAADRVLRLLFDLARQSGAALLLITHDVDVARRADRIAVMANGRIAEEGATADMLRAATSPDAKALLARQFTLPVRTAPVGPPFLSVSGLHAWGGGKALVADGAFSLARGERLAIVGRSGSGKTSLMRAILGLLAARGKIIFDGEATVPGSDVLRRALAMVFQDPATSFNPRHSILRIVTEPLYRERLPSDVLRAKAEAALAEVDLPGVLDRRPHAFSGGQRQRIAIARALIGGPQLLIADEAVSALDAALRADVIALLDRLVREQGIGLIFITHDLRLVRDLADRVLVMEGGRVVEDRPTADLFSAPGHSATRALLEASVHSADTGVGDNSGPAPSG